MSTTRTKMTGKKTVSIEIAAKKLKSELNAELIEESVCRLDDKATVILLVFEKYFMRNGSYAGLTVQLIENENLQIANIIASAGGEGIFNINWGANSDFAYAAENILANNDFIRNKNN